MVDAGGLDLAEELRAVLRWENSRMGAVSASVLRRVIAQLDRSDRQLGYADAAKLRALLVEAEHILGLDMDLDSYHGLRRRIAAEVGLNVDSGW